MIEEIFLVATPGLSEIVAEEAREGGLKVTRTEAAGVTLSGDWPEVWRANLVLRTPTRVLVRVASFRAMHLAQLDKRARKLPWRDWLNPGASVSVEATCRKSRIYHAGAARDRIAGALDLAGFRVVNTGGLSVRLRIEDDLATISLDTSGEMLHKRGLKTRVNKAPMRETLAAAFLRAAGYRGDMPVSDPMCGSGTFVIEAAEMATNLHPGRARSFAFADLASFDAEAYADLQSSLPSAEETALRFRGSDRDAGAVAMSRENAQSAGLEQVTRFDVATISDTRPPDGPPGLVIVNPPYGGRIGKSGALRALYGSFGATMKTHFVGWKIGLITTDASLAKTTGLPFEKPGPVVDHGGLKVRLWQAQL